MVTSLFHMACHMEESAALTSMRLDVSQMIGVFFSPSAPRTLPLDQLARSTSLDVASSARTLPRFRSSWRRLLGQSLDSESERLKRAAISRQVFQRPKWRLPSNFRPGDR